MRYRTCTALVQSRIMNISTTKMWLLVMLATASMLTACGGDDKDEPKPTADVTVDGAADGEADGGGQAGDPEKTKQLLTVDQTGSFVFTGLKQQAHVVYTEMG
ncbi:MAG: hypothetical protein KC502_14225, partial [Myxococcales bacterium]|nr:hypothetical protein [Myxococcales bacterium]